MILEEQKTFFGHTVGEIVRERLKKDDEEDDEEEEHFTYEAFTYDWFVSLSVALACLLIAGLMSGLAIGLAAID